MIRMKLAALKAWEAWAERNDVSLATTLPPTPRRAAVLIRYHLQNADISPGDRAELAAFADYLDGAQ